MRSIGCPESEISSRRESCLSVVANSAKVTALVLKKEMLEFLSRDMRKVLLNRINNYEDLDRPANAKKYETLKKDLKEWEKYKEKLSAQIVKKKSNVVAKP